MQIRKSLLPAFLGVLLLIAACKKHKNEPANGGGSGTGGVEGEQIAQLVDVLSSSQTQFYTINAAIGGNPQMAVLQLRDWLNSKENVASTILRDDTMGIYIETKAGLPTIFSVMSMNDDGTPYTRGGARTTGLQVLGSNGSCSHPVENKKILIWAAEGTKGGGYSDQGFYNAGELAALSRKITDNTAGTKVTIIENKACTPKTISQFADYGMVIMDTHGLEIGFFAGNRVSISETTKDTAVLKKTILDQLGQEDYKNVLNKKLLVADVVWVDKKKGLNWQTAIGDHSYHVFITSAYVQDNMPSLSKTILYGNMCYSGATLNNSYWPGEAIKTAIVARNPAVYYSYAFTTGKSKIVSNDFAIAMEDSIIKRLFINKDSTGISNLKQDNTSEYSDWLSTPNPPYLFFTRYGADNYCYACGANLVDDRDGEVYKTVCIGRQVWMAENLRYNAAGSVAYGPASYGRLYTVQQIMDGAGFSSLSPSGVRGICPKGWHVPSGTEFSIMISALGGDQEAGAKLKKAGAWPTAANATGESGFDALPSGSYSVGKGYVGGSLAFFRSTTQGSGNGVQTLYLHDFTKAVTQPAYSQFDSSGIYPWMVSCRCVQD